MYTNKVEPLSHLDTGYRNEDKKVESEEKINKVKLIPVSVEPVVYCIMIMRYTNKH